MFSNKAAKLILFALIVLPVLFTSACAASSTPTAAPAATSIAPAATTAPTTAPAVPTALPTSLPPSPTVAPTFPPPATPTTPPPAATSAPQADQLTVWCMPAGYTPVSATSDPTSMPKGAVTGSTVNGTLSFQVPF